MRAFSAVLGVGHPDRFSLRKSQEPARVQPGSPPGPSGLASAERTAGPSHHLTGAEATWAWRRCHVTQNDESTSTPTSNIEARRLPRGPRSPEEERGAPPRHRGQFLSEPENYHLGRLRISRCFFVNNCDTECVATEMESARRGELKEYKDLPGGPQGTLAPWSSRRREMQPRRDVDGGGQSHAPWPVARGRAGRPRGSSRTATPAAPTPKLWL